MEREDYRKEAYLAEFREGQEERFFEELLYVKKNTSIVTGSLSDVWLDVITMQDIEPLRNAPTDSNLKIRLDGREYPVYGMAMNSIIARAKDKADILKEFSDKKVAAHINMSWEELGKKKYQAIIRGGGLHALMSQRYIPIPQLNVYKAFLDTIKSKYVYADVVFRGAFYSHTLTAASYTIDDADLLHDLKEKLASVKFPVTDALMVAVKLFTSDTGDSSVSVSMSLEMGQGRRFQFQKPLRVPHRDNQTFENVVENFKKLFALLDEGIENLMRLADIKISYPTSVAANLVKDKRYKIPRMLMDQIMDQYVMYEQMGTEITGVNFLRILGMMQNTPVFDAYCAKTKLQVEDAIARFAFISESQLKKFDTKGEVIY